MNIMTLDLTGNNPGELKFADVDTSTTNQKNIKKDVMTILCKNYLLFFKFFIQQMLIKLFITLDVMFKFIIIIIYFLILSFHQYIRLL